MQWYQQNKKKLKKTQEIWIASQLCWFFFCTHAYKHTHAQPFRCMVNTLCIQNCICYTPVIEISVCRHHLSSLWRSASPIWKANWTFQSQHGLRCDTTLQPFHKHNSSSTSHLLHMYNLTTNVVACRMFCSRDTFRNIYHNYNIYLNSFCNPLDKL